MVDPIVTHPHPPVSVPAALPNTVALNPPMVGTVSPFVRVDGQNRDLILEAIRAWARGPLVAWAGAWQQSLTEWLEGTSDWLETWNEDVIRYVEDVLDTVLNSSIELQDPVMSGIITDPDSETRRTLDGLYLPAFNIELFGARTSNLPGVNQTAIQNALNFAALLRGRVFVPSGTYYHDQALMMPDHVALTGAGKSSVLKVNSLDSGGAGVGHRQIDTLGKTGWSIRDLMLDAGDMTVFTTGMRSIFNSGSSHFSVKSVYFRTPGAAVASIGSSHFTIDDLDVEVVSTTGAALHDGVVDQWGGCHDFTIGKVRINGNGIARYPILVTGERTDGSAAGNYNFSISNPHIYNALRVGIWINGREGINRSFSIENPIIDGVAEFFGVAIADSDDWVVTSPLIKNTGSNAIRVYAETSEGGVTSGRDGTISSPVVVNANLLLSGSSTEGAAILVAAGSRGIVLSGGRVKGSTHTYAVAWSNAITDCVHIEGSYDKGTLGKILNNPAGGEYTPVGTVVTNASAVGPNIATWRRDGDVVTVFGRVSVTPAAAGQTLARLTLPVPSALSNVATDLSGSAATQFGVPAALLADIVNDAVTIQFTAASAVANIFYYNYTYKIIAA